MKLVALVERIDHVCTRYRLEAFRPILAEAGYNLDYELVPQTWLARRRLGPRLAEADAVIVQRKLPDEALLAAIRRRAKFLIFDFDDAVWLRDSYSPKGLESVKLSRRFQRLVGVCDLVIAGNAYLADHAKRFTNASVEIIPTCVDPARYGMVDHTGEGEDCRLVWIGSASTLQGLDRFRAVLEQLGLGVPGLRLRLVCDRFLEFRNLAVECVPWSEATEAESLRSADIGISWIPDDAWSRGKCGLKILQYQAAGLPVIANPVGVHPERVQTNRMGIRATEPQEWIDAGRTLIAYPGTRRAYGSAGREQVVRHFSVQAGALRWIECLQKLLTPKRTRADG